MYRRVYGTVVNNKDKLKRGRLQIAFSDWLEPREKAKAPDNERTLQEEWIPPLFPFAGKNCGYFFLPPVDARVECRLFVGRDNTDSADVLEIHWVAAIYNKDNPIPDEFQDNYPHTVGFKSIKGHVIMMDDVKDGELIRFKHFNKEQYIELDPDGSIVCKTKNGHTLILDEKNDKVSLRYKDTDVVTINADGIFFGTETASEPMVLGDLWKDMMDRILLALSTHTHPTGMGPSGPPLEATSFTDEQGNLAATVSDFIKGQKDKP